MKSILMVPQRTEKCLFRSVLKTMHMINCLVKRLLAYGFERSETARFDIFPQRFSNEFQVFNVFHNHPNRSMMRDKFFQPLGADFGVRFLLFPSIDRSQGPFSLNVVSLPALVFHCYPLMC